MCKPYKGWEFTKDLFSPSLEEALRALYRLQARNQEGATFFVSAFAAKINMAAKSSFFDWERALEALACQEAKKRIDSDDTDHSEPVWFQGYDVGQPYSLDLICYLTSDIQPKHLNTITLKHYPSLSRTKAMKSVTGGWPPLWRSAWAICPR